MANCAEKSLWEQVCEEFEAEQPSSPHGKLREIDPTAVEIHESYLERNVFPVLLQGLEALLGEGQKYGWFEREKPACVPYVFLIKWLYNHNSQQQGRDPVNFHDIPFVKDFLSTHPEHHIPRFLLLSEEQAAVLIQAFWRGYKIRVRPDVQELHRWQREQREQRDIRRTAAEFWGRQESRGEHVYARAHTHTHTHTHIQVTATYMVTFMLLNIRKCLNFY
ncbi:IQ domain-containing protein K isoform X2 [Nothobranchius furzeri]|uniref:IQ domain-containing protein K isoform X2 n=1 Tax=Nothobranchius furzeri TaxID=105023 RepID=UPI0039048F4D